MLTTMHRNEELEKPEKWVKLITSTNSFLQVILDKENKPVLTKEWLTIRLVLYLRV